MLNLIHYPLLILEISFVYSNTEPIKGHNITTAEEGEFSFIAGFIQNTGYLNAERDYYCAGVLITKKHVLTAAHCYESPFSDDIQVVLGSVDLRNGTKYNVTSGINYDRWATSKRISKNGLVNDIAIVKLSEEVDENVAKPAELSSKKWLTLFSCEKVTVAGWGQVNIKPDKASRYLQKAPLTIMTPRQCRTTISQLLNKRIFVDDNIFCTKVEPYTLLGCGDSGGPVLNGKNQVIGINMGTCPRYMSLFPFQLNSRVNLHANVQYYKAFIADVLKNY